ncbi:ExeM/NucH family extracellular endonuclease [Kushneria sp. EE4]
MSFFSRTPAPWSFHQEAQQLAHGLGALTGWTQQWLSPLESLITRLDGLLERIGDSLFPEAPARPEPPQDVPVDPETPATPVITVDTERSEGLTLDDAGASIRGVMGDPTDPASTRGIAFAFTDDDTPREQLTVTIDSSDPGVARAALDDQDVLRIAPVNAGNATITVTVSDGERDSQYTIDYAAADGRDTNQQARFHTGASDTSAAIAIGESFFLAGDDEDQTLRLYDRDQSGAALKSFDLNDALGLEDGDEVDIESVADVGNGHYYWLGSLENSERSMIFETRVTGDSVEDLEVTVTGQFSGLHEAVMRWSASEAPGLNLADGFQVEGALYRDGTLHLGMREPIGDDGRASVVTVTNVDALMAAGSADGAEFGAPLRLDLDGRTIRDITPIGDGTHLISAGPAEEDDGDDTNNDFQLYRWDGAHKAVPVEGVDLNTNVEATGGTAETLSNIRVNEDGSVSLDVAYDNGTSDWSDDGTRSKDLDDDLQTFTSSTLTFDALPSLALERGDIALTAIDTEADTFSLVALSPVTPGATLTFESGSEPITWTVPEDGVPAGTIIDSEQFDARLPLSLDAGLTVRDGEGTPLYRLGSDDGADLSLPAGETQWHYAGDREGSLEDLREALGDSDAWQTGASQEGNFTVNTGHIPLPPPEPQDLGIAVTEIWPGQNGSNLSEDWFEIVNTGSDTIDFTTTPLYYDDDSADPDDAVMIEGLTTLAPGATALVVANGDEADVAEFRNAWQSTLEDSTVEIGHTGSAAGLGQGGDEVTLWLGEPGRETLAAREAYPDTTGFDGASWDVIHQRFTTRDNGGVVSDTFGGDDGDMPAVAAPGRQPGSDGETDMSQASLLISEYVEGSGYNKAIELTNRGGSDLSLAGFTLSLYSNGNTEANASQDLDQYGSLAPGGTLVLANSQAEQALLDRSDATSGVTSYNGNDALVLTNGAGEIQDIVGTVGDDAYFGRDITLRRDEAVTEGSDRFDADQWQEYPQDTFDGLGGDGAGDAPDSDAPGDAPDNEAPGNDRPDSNGDPMDLPPVELISTIQGSAMSSERAGDEVSLEAIVTLDARDGMNGFFLQEEDADRDGDKTTSEGIFVYLPDDSNVADFTVGDRVRLTGTVEEYQGKTQLSDIAALEVTGRDQPLPTITELDLPIDDKSSLAARESMRVSFQGEDGAPLTVTDTYELGRYGTVTLSADGRLQQFTEVNAPDQAGNQQWLDQLESRSILLDDASSAQNPESILFGRGGEPLSADNTLRGGDTLDQATGVLDFAYQQWRIQSDQGLDFQPANARPEQPDAQALGDAPLKVASFNVLNYFETLDQSGNQITTPEGTEHSPRGANSDQELARQQDKLVNAIVDSDADIVGLNEIANDGFGADSSIAGLVEALNARSDDGWDYITPRDDSGNVVSPGSDAIAVGLIYQGDSVTPENDAAVNTSGAFATGNRAPMLQTFQDNDSAESFSIAVNHFKSKGSVINGEEAIGDGQGNNNPTRVEAAEQLAAWIETDPTDSGNSDVLIIGDLNSYAMEDPITTLTGEGYTLLDNDYSYSYDGQWGSLDHALASASMSDQVTGVTTWHINADEPTVLDYNTEYKSAEQVESLYDDSPFRASDHDPILIGIDPGADTQQAVGF